MSKKIFFGLLLLANVLTMAGCSQGDKNEMNDENAPVNEEMNDQDTLDLERGRGSND